MQGGRPRIGLDQSQALVQLGPGVEVGADLEGVLLAGEQDADAPQRRQVAGERGGRPHGGVEVPPALAPVEHHERARVHVGVEAPFHQLVVARQRRPVDARHRRAGPVGADALQLERGLARAADAGGAVARRARQLGGQSHGIQPREHQELQRTGLGRDPPRQAQRVVRHQPRGGQRDATPAGKARLLVEGHPRVGDTGPPRREFSTSSPGRGSGARTARLAVQGTSSSTVRAPVRRSMRAPAAATSTQAGAASPAITMAMPGMASETAPKAPPQAASAAPKAAMAAARLTRPERA